jgi:SHS2 domain-containing protein
MPAEGVYAAFASLGLRRFPALADVGGHYRSEEDEPSLRVHILEDDAERVGSDQVYGCHLAVEFVSQLRPAERAHETARAAARLEQDIKDARRALGHMGHETGRLHGGFADARSPRHACPYRYEEVEHTADRALSVWGKHPQDLFAGAARGMFDLMADVEGLVATTWRAVQLEDWDQESLLVAWLNELLFLSEAEDLLLVDYRIESLTDTALVAQVGGTPGPVTKAAIKAATFHNLAVVREARGWATVVTFDV